MAVTLASFETQHEDMIHDAQMDYYAKRLATCSSDRKIKIFEIVQGRQNHVADLVGHTGPVWQVSWAHPKFGSILASCSHDRSVLIWKERENAKNYWVQIYTHSEHQYSVNSVAWAPHEFGLMLAAASSDGTVSVLSYKDGTWQSSKFRAHNFAVNSVSWAPVTLPDNQNSPLHMRIVTSGSDNLVKIWSCDLGQTSQKWTLDCELSGHESWVRDAQWAPNVGLSANMIASGSQDGTVFIWIQENASQSKSSWTKTALEPSLDEPIWRLSWSLTGSVLAVSSGDNKVTLWKESLKGQFKLISTVDQNPGT